MRVIASAAVLRSEEREGRFDVRYRLPRAGVRQMSRRYA